MSTQKPQELWSREPPHNGRCAKNKNILWISLISRARGSPSRPTDRTMCIIWRKDFLFSAVVTWDFQVGCTEEMSSFCPKGRSTSITSKYLHFFQPYANKTVITDSSMVRFVTSFLLADFWLEHLTADLTQTFLSFYSHYSHTLPVCIQGWGYEEWKPQVNQRALQWYK